MSAQNSNQNNTDPKFDLPENFIFDPLEDVDNPRKTNVKFSEVLDFSFPDRVEPDIKEVGEVIYIGDGVCRMIGLSRAQIEDIVDVTTDSGVEKCLILGIEDTYIETVVLGDYSHIRQGDRVVSTNSKLKIPVGKGLFTRVINPLGKPIDAKGKLDNIEGLRDVEFPAPPVMEREPIYEPLKTGIMVTDATIPIGLGQRELVIGDRKTGKTRFCTDVIANQKLTGVICIYVGVGSQAAKAKEVYEGFQKRGALDYTIMVISTSDDPPSLQYLSPYVGIAIAEHFMYQGKKCLIVYDDLSKQAKAYRQVSLLLKRSPGRDAYPGDIFFLHSRLLERSCKLSTRLGAGAITALPIAETQSGDVSDYIITNLMSITDGHIYLDANLMHEGILPAVNSGTSVSRIGSKVQTSLAKKVGELASRALARYNELKSFEALNTEVAEETLRDLARGKKVKEMLSQVSEICYSSEEIVILLYLVTSDKINDIELFELAEFKSRFLEYFRQLATSELKEKCNKAKNIEDVEPEFNQILNSFMEKWKTKNF